MTLYLISAWALVLLYATVIGVWTGGLVAPALGVGALMLGAIVLQAASFGRARRRARGANAADRVVVAAGLCEAVSAPAAVVAAGLVRDANRAFLALLDFGGRRDEVIGLPISNLVHPLDQGRLVALLASDAGQDETDRPAALRMLKADGSSVRAQACTSQLAGEPGTSLLQLGLDALAEAPASGSDISSVVLHQLDLVVVSVDSGGEMTYANRAWERLAGDPQVDVRGRTFPAYLHPGDRDPVEKDFARLLNGRLDHLAREARLISTDGSVHWMDLRAHPCVLGDGEVIGVLATLHEITPRKKVEESATAARRLLPMTLLANFPGMVYRARNDADWTMDFVSDGSLELTGFEPFELVKNARTSYAQLIHPDDREFVRQQVESNLALRKPFRMTYRIVDAQGKQCWVWEQGCGVFSSTGEVLALEGFITDVRMRASADQQTLRRLGIQPGTEPADEPHLRQALSYVLHHSAAARYACALFWIDIDDFDRVREQLGARGADQAIGMLADRLDAVQAPGSTVARLGSGQFAVLLTDFRLGGAPRAVPEDKEVMPACSNIAGSLARAFATPLPLDGGPWSPTASIGVAISNARYESADMMLAAARRAALEARQRLGPGHCEFADE
ncbi:MAG TPA: PAS domain-containing protein [Burkholderiaceae bacterium]|jgi:PAS domain S-box-containing protein|nr:PAS domain-containing protein [Burkholderiaceae bacterium]